MIAQITSVIPLGAAAAVLLSSAVVHSQESTRAPEGAAPLLNVVVTSGEAVMRVAPDQAFVTIAVENRSRVPRDAQRQNAETMTSVQQKLKGVGLPEDALRTTSVELSPEFDYANGKQQLRGYVARNSIELRVDALERLGEVIDAAVGSGATNVTGVRFDVKKRTELERDALQRAVAQARARAEGAAAGAGLTLGRVLRIDDSGPVPIPGPRPVMMAAARAEAPETMTPVAPGEIEVRARVTVTSALAGYR